jgi:hypothetical protein
MESGVALIRCALCEREVNKVTYHHLIPKQKGGKHTDTVPLCQPCHTTLHATFSNAELATMYNSIPALQAAERLQKYLNWIKNKRIEKISQRRKRYK